MSCVLQNGLRWRRCGRSFGGFLLRWWFCGLRHHWLVWKLDEEHITQKENSKAKRDKQHKEGNVWIQNPFIVRFVSGWVKEKIMIPDLEMRLIKCWGTQSPHNVTVKAMVKRRFLFKKGNYQFNSEKHSIMSYFLYQACLLELKRWSYNHWTKLLGTLVSEIKWKT